MMYQKTTNEAERIGSAIVQAAYEIHTEIGPGLLERIYESCMEQVLKEAGFDVKRQVTIPVHFRGTPLKAGLRLDLLIDNQVIVEIKSAEVLHPVYEAQIISYLKLSNKHLGFLINFNVPLIKQGIKRYINFVP
ncbi:MAG TPA: GxxExxY protein [Saprospirales bacterium]|nr:GxxExxY protein [Saprospirales bacterium]